MNNQSEIANTIGPISTLEFMVESAFNFDSKQSKKMLLRIKSLRKHIFRWRTILGDGNCFFRAVIFSYFENLILEKNIILLKHICLEIYEKFHNDNPLISKLPTTLRNQYNLNDKSHLIVINVLFHICNLLQNSTKKDEANCTFQAFEVFYEIIIESKDFDYMLIKFLRYKLYEYITANKDRIYHMDYQVKLGNLLPMEYEKSDDNFDFQSFFEKELLPLYKEAEMISIHLIPFVLKVDLVILTYDFNNSSEKMKDFSCFLKLKHRIIVLYKKSHYDLIYDKPYFDKNAKYLTEYSNLYESEKSVLSSEQLLDLETNSYKYNEVDDEEIKEEQNAKISRSLDPTNGFTLIDNDIEDFKDINFSVTNEEFKEDMIKKEFDSGNYKNFFLKSCFNKDNISYIAKTYSMEQIKKDFVRNLRDSNSNLLLDDLNERQKQKCFICEYLGDCFIFLKTCKSCVAKIVLEVLKNRFIQLIKFSNNEKGLINNLQDVIIYKDTCQFLI